MKRLITGLKRHSWYGYSMGRPWHFEGGAQKLGRSDRHPHWIFFSPLMNIPWKFHALIRPLNILPLSYPTNN